LDSAPAHSETKSKFSSRESEYIGTPMKIGRVDLRRILIMDPAHRIVSLISLKLPL
jgi:hypothetical protein